MSWGCRYQQGAIGRLGDQLSRIESKLNALSSHVRSLREEGREMAVEIDNLIQQVQRTTDVTESAVQTINGIAARLQAAIDAALRGGATPEVLAQLQREADTLHANSTRLADAIVANTPAGPPPARR
jgi:hypothetical protein